MEKYFFVAEIWCLEIALFSGSHRRPDARKANNFACVANINCNTFYLSETSKKCKISARKNVGSAKIVWRIIYLLGELNCWRWCFKQAKLLAVRAKRLFFFYFWASKIVNGVRKMLADLKKKNLKKPYLWHTMSCMYLEQ